MRGPIALVSKAEGHQNPRHLSSASSITLVDSDHEAGDDEADENKPLSSTFNPPEYTWKEIYAAIPTHCLKSNTLLSLSYVARDFLYVSLLFTLATQIHHLPTPTTRFFAWAAYAFAQGLVFTGLWELAHECGHGALSPQKWINNTLGLVIHSFVLVPFHSWRITHGHHHKATNNLDRDIAFVPTLKEDYDAERKTHSRIWDMIEDMPVVTLGFLFFHQLVAFPIYLMNNNFALERMAKVPWWKRSHFYLGGDGPNFKPTDTRDILKSDVGIAIALTLLWAAYVRFGAWNVFLFYGAPYLWTNHWILTITYLQHTDITLPYYPASSWTFLRGAASSVDRDFGWIGRHLFHGAIETHVVHHHSSKIPFYHAAEASTAIRKVMGVHYRSDFKTPYIWAWWRNYRMCRWVEEQEGEGKGTGVWFFGKAQ